MGKKDKNKKKGKGAEKTVMKTDRKLAAKQKKMLAKIGEADIEEIVAKLEAEESRLKEVTEISTGPPPPRSNFSLCAHPDKDELVLFGGEFFNGQKVCVYNDFYFYNISKNEWKLLKSPSGPAPRSGHQMVPVASQGGQLWLFGGEHASPSQLQFYHYKDLWTYHINGKKWEKVTAPNGPSPRSGHRMVLGKKKLIIFGGFYDNNQSYRYYNDLHIFSLESYTWLQLDLTGSPPPARSGCCMASSPDGKIYVWGGYSKLQVKKDVDKGTVHTDMYSLVPDKADENKLKWMSVKTGGIRPAPRSGVASSVAPNGKVYCFGGVMDVEEDDENLQGQMGNDLYVLDLSSLKWSLPDICRRTRKVQTDDKSGSENIPKETTVTTDGIFTVTVGGNSSSGSVSTAPDQPKFKTSPPPRMNTGLVVFKGHLYLYGGLHEEGSKQFTLSDFYSLDLHKMDEWKTIIASNLDTHEWIGSDSEGDSSNSDNSESDDEDSSSDSSSDMEIG